VNILNKLNELINLIKNDEIVIRFRELENVIDHNESIKTDFNKLLHLQKVMVNKEYKKDSTLDDAKQEYQKQLKIVLNYPVVEEYLDVLDVINNDLSLIKSIIEQEIAIDFD
jgi:cell fate (sporulation/competence/biofilm development) regulator YmcA (YheA/YmcA/DUF963 family)